VSQSTETINNSWFEPTKKALYDYWVQTTHHTPDSSYGTWACEIAQGCRTCNEHLSLPCSLLKEANQIASFLNLVCFSDDPEVFFKFYLILLSEFVGQLHDVAGLLDLRIGKPPKEICLWANRWAKHRLHMLVQHHPVQVFADQFGDEWPGIRPRLATSLAEDRCGRKLPVMIVDSQWLSDFADGKRPDLALANGQARALIVVPPLKDFLIKTCDYFRCFIDAALKAPERVRQFQSPHFAVNCGTEAYLITAST